MTDPRVTYNGEWLDEIVADNVTVHIEALSVHDFMVRVYSADGAVDVHLNVRDLTEYQDPQGLPVTVGPPLTWCTEWTDRFKKHHACTVTHYSPVDKYTWHRCECGSKRRGPSCLSG